MVVYLFVKLLCFICLGEGNVMWLSGENDDPRDFCSECHWRNISPVMFVCPSCQAAAQTPSSQSRGPQRREKLWTCSSFWPTTRCGCLPPVRWIPSRSTDGYNDLIHTGQTDFLILLIKWFVNICNSNSQLLLSIDQTTILIETLFVYLSSNLPFVPRNSELLPSWWCAIWPPPETLWLTQTTGVWWASAALTLEPSVSSAASPWTWSDWLIGCQGGSSGVVTPTRCAEASFSLSKFSFSRLPHRSYFCFHLYKRNNPWCF